MFQDIAKDIAARDDDRIAKYGQRKTSLDRVVNLPKHHLESKVPRQQLGMNLSTAGKMKILAAKSRKRAHKRQRLWIIKPNMPAKIYWDIFVGVIIVYSVINVPYRAAFSILASGPWYYIEVITRNHSENS